MPNEPLEEIILRTAEAIAGHSLASGQRLDVLRKLSAVLRGSSKDSESFLAHDASLDQRIEARLARAQEYALEAHGLDPDAAEVIFTREQLDDTAARDTFEPTLDVTDAQAGGTDAQTGGTASRPVHRIVYTNDAGLAGMSIRLGRAPDGPRTLGIDSHDRPGHSDLPALTVVSIGHELGGVESAILRSLPDGRERSRLREDARGRDLVGSVLDETYRVTSFVGRGGFGVVYKAGVVGLEDVEVAIKVLDPRYAQRRSVQQTLKDEFRRLSKLKHPGIVEWKHFGETADGIVYFAMEYLDGEELSKVLKREKKLPPARAFPLLLQILDALRAAHDLPGQSKLCHLDLKPANIFILKRGTRGQEQVKLIDFGISQYTGLEARDAEALEDPREEGGEPRSRDTQRGEGRSTRANGPGSSMTMTQRVAGGTPLFASPEQCKHLRRDRDIAPLGGPSDIYSFAVVAYLLLTGQYPYPEFEDLRRRMSSQSPDEVERARLDTYQIHLDQKPTPLRKLEPKLDRRLGRLLERCLAKRPEDRFANTDEAYAAFKAVLDPVRRRVLVLVAALALAVVGLAAHSALRPDPRENRTPTRVSGTYTPYCASSVDGPVFELPSGVLTGTMQLVAVNDSGSPLTEVVVTAVAENRVQLKRRLDAADSDRPLEVFLTEPGNTTRFGPLDLYLDPDLDEREVFASFELKSGNERMPASSAGAEGAPLAVLRSKSLQGTQVRIEAILATGCPSDLLTQARLRTVDVPGSDWKPMILHESRTLNESRLVGDVLVTPSQSQLRVEFQIRPRSSSMEMDELEAVTPTAWPEGIAVVDHLASLKGEPAVSIEYHGLAPAVASQSTRIEGAKNNWTAVTVRRREAAALAVADIELRVDLDLESNGLPGRLVVLEASTGRELDAADFAAAASEVALSIPLAAVLEGSRRVGDVQHAALQLLVAQEKLVLGAEPDQESRWSLELQWRDAPADPVLSIVAEGTRPLDALLSAAAESEQPLLHTLVFTRAAGAKLFLTLGSVPSPLWCTFGLEGEGVPRTAPIPVGGKTLNFNLTEFPVDAESAQFALRAWSLDEGPLPDPTPLRGPDFEWLITLEACEPLGIKAFAVRDGVRASTPCFDSQRPFTTVGPLAFEALVFEPVAAHGVARITVGKADMEAGVPVLARDLGFEHGQLGRLDVEIKDDAGRTKTVSASVLPSLRRTVGRITKPTRSAPWEPIALQERKFLIEVEIDEAVGEASEAFADQVFVEILPAQTGPASRAIESSSGAPIGDEGLTCELNRSRGKWISTVTLPEHFAGARATLRGTILDVAQRESALAEVVDVEVPQFPFAYPTLLEIELAPGVAPATMLFVDAAAAAADYYLLEYRQGETWNQIRAELRSAGVTGVAAYDDTGQNAFEGPFKVPDSVHRWASNFPVPSAHERGYYLDRAEVTLGQFQAFLANPNADEARWWPLLPGGSATAIRQRIEHLQRLVDEQRQRYGSDQYPVTCVDWHSANAFALWSGRRLQTWFEWEFAARGGAATPRCVHAPRECLASALEAAPVGDEFVHLTGNTQEWTSSPYILAMDVAPMTKELIFEPITTSLCRKQNRSSISGPGFIVVGGGVHQSGDRRASMRFDHTAVTTRNATTSTFDCFVGFRCATYASELERSIEAARNQRGADDAPMRLDLRR